MSISAPNNLTTGQPLRMDCTMVAVRGITSTVDIVWYGSGGQLRNASDVTATIINGATSLYRDSFNISSLTRHYDGSLYFCAAIIYSEPSLFIYSSIRLNVTCKFTIKYTYFYHTYIYSCIIATLRVTALLYVVIIQTMYSGTPFIQTPWDLGVFTTLDFPDLRVKHNIHVFVQFL